MVFSIENSRIPQLDTVDFETWQAPQTHPLQPSGSTLPLTSEPFE